MSGWLAGQELFPKAELHALRDDARDYIGGPARPGRHNHGDELRMIGLRSGNPRHGGEGRRACCEPE
jgi:hypothetical protein